MKKIIFFVMLLLSVAFVAAHSGEIEEGKILAESNVSCNSLNDAQLEAIGEYYMEQMHPGEAHELMDSMMGGEGSESLRQMHIYMAKRLYCGEYGNNYGMMGNMMGGGMMPMMMNMMGGNMMSGNMMSGNMMSGNNGLMPMMAGGNMMGYANNYGMMGYGSLWSLWGLLWMAVWIGILALIVWAIYKLISQGVKGENSIEIIKKRYAKGEITKKEFEEIKREIER